jgi:hypothetical protein
MIGGEIGMGNFINMTGWVMKEHGVSESRWTVLERAEDRHYKNGTTDRCWLCECSCEEHNQKIVPEKSLKRGDSKSCGCLGKERIAEVGHKNKKSNIYDLSGEYGIGYCSNTNTPFYFDLEDYDKIKDYCWYEHEPVKGYHTVMAYDKTNKKVVKLWYVLGYKGCDHVDRNPMNCRKGNLREATQQENMRNISLQKNNASGITGVSIHKQTGKWRARVMIDYKEIGLGLFENKDDAIKARLQAEAKYYGAFAPQRHLFEKYGITTQNDYEVEE